MEHWPTQLTLTTCRHTDFYRRTNYDDQTDNYSSTTVVPSFPPPRLHAWVKERVAFIFNGPKVNCHSSCELFPHTANFRNSFNLHQKSDFSHSVFKNYFRKVRGINFLLHFPNSSVNFSLLSANVPHHPLWQPSSTPVIKIPT